MSARPDFREESPTIVGFDYNALDAAVGSASGVPNSHSAPVVRHEDVIRTGNNATHADIGRLEIASSPPQPPHGHADLIPGYPWQGHPGQAYSHPFMGPSGTSPMHRSGPNIGAHANAPGVPGAVSGSGFPQAVAGTYVPVPGQPSPISGYAGIDPDAELGDAAARKTRRQARRTAPITVRGRGFVYKLFYGTNGQDGDIEIVVSGEPSVLPAGSIVSRGSSRWSAIVAEVGTWADNRARARQATASAVATGLTSVTQAAFGRRRRRRGRGPASPMPPLDDGFEEETPGLPPWLLPVGIGAVVFLVVLSQQKD